MRKVKPKVGRRKRKKRLNWRMPTNYKIKTQRTMNPLQAFFFWCIRRAVAMPVSRDAFHMTRESESRYWYGK